MNKDFKTAGPNELENSENQAGKVAGFWLGLWHGLIAPITFTLSLFKEDIGVYDWFQLRPGYSLAPGHFMVHFQQDGTADKGQI
jgi:hypothetical protein